MPGHLKALIVVVGLAVPIFLLMRPLLLSAGYDASTYRRHTLAWFLITFVVFLSHNFWLFSFLVAFFMYSLGKRENNPLALYFIALFAAPHFTMTLPGIGPIQNIFDVTHIRTLNLSVLLPFAVLLRKDIQRQKRKIPIYLDLPLMLFLALCIGKFLAVGSPTQTLRLTFNLLVDIALPYYVASRGLRSLPQFREVAAAAALAITATASIAIFESGKHWLLYEALRNPLGIEGHQVYRTRSAGGPLRAVTVTAYPIVLGYVIMFGLGFFAFVTSFVKHRKAAMLTWLLLLGGLIASLSRGPWIGAAAMAMVIIFLGPARSKGLVLGGLTAGISLLVLSATPSGRMILELLPFVGTAETGTADYRARLWDVSMLVFWQNPLLGDLHFMENPILEQMRQGEGIIDIVNSFLQVALPYGFVGIALFSSALLFPTYAAWRARRALPATSVAAERLGRTLIALMAGVLVTIGTASGIGVISTLYWILAGLLVSFSQMVMESTVNENQSLRSELRIATRNARHIARSKHGTHSKVIGPS
jgi:hypothetical protein